MKESLQRVTKEFLYIFGTQTTTNHDLKRYAKMLKIKNFYVVMSDEVNELPENNFSAILNFQLSSETGSHWVGLYSRKTESASRMTKSASRKTKSAPADAPAGARSEGILYYFDSYGTPVQQQVIYKYKHIRAHDYKIQPLNSSMCGQLSLLVIYLLSNGFKYEDIVNSLKK